MYLPTLGSDTVIVLLKYIQILSVRKLRLTAETNLKLLQILPNLGVEIIGF